MLLAGEFEAPNEEVAIRSARFVLAAPQEWDRSVIWKAEKFEE
jgi:hypothetical protein